MSTMLIERFNAQWQNPRSRRWWILAIVFTVVLIMAFYSLSNPTNLAHDHTLIAGDWMGAAICHRITERSFTIAGRQFPLCARCTGMYLGVMLTFIVLGVAGRLRWGELPPLRILLVLIGFIAIMGIDGVNSYTHFFPDFPHVYEPRNWLRLLTGTGTGLAMGLFIFPILAQTLWKLEAYRPVLRSFRELLAVMSVAGTAVFLLLSNQPTINYVLAIVSTAGVVTIVMAINTILLLVVLRRDGLATSWVQTAVPLSIGLALTLIELSAIALIRFNYTGTIIGFPGL
ncbi:MAG: DUF2085 domain-containing protein [Chloroflexi bacterium]|nr:DUF2085 domain-containing protein [Chloroflexota bacterium]